MKMAVPLFALLLLLGPVRAQEDELPPPAAKVPEDPEVEPADDETAEKMIEALEAAMKTKDENQVIAALEPFYTCSHEDFLKELESLARNRSVGIRIAALRALGSQVEPAKKITRTLATLLKWKPMEDEPLALAAVIDALRRHKFEHPMVIDELVSHFRKQNSPAVMGAAALYFGAIKKKDVVGMLAYWVEAPQPANVNSPSNPPASYWKRMWEIWNEIQHLVRHSLKEITGQEFKTKAEWEEWLRTREAKREGYD